MNHVIVGAGPAGIIAAETLRRLDQHAQITVIGAETNAPYSRMAIPYFLADDITESGTHLRHSANHFLEQKIEVRQGVVAALSPKDRNIRFDDNQTLSYDKLLLACGSHTLRPPIPGIDLPAIENCWTLEDARKIIAHAKPGSRVVLMGAGFIGCIVLEALVARKVDLTVVEMAPHMLARMMDETGGAMIKRWCEKEGVKVLTSTKVTEINQADTHLHLTLEGSSDVDADLVVCATGVAPNIDFLANTGIATDHGILVDEHLQTSVEHIYAAGDVAQGYDFSTGKQEVHAIQPTASEHGRLAAQNMSGKSTRFAGSLSMNVLDTLGLVSSSYGLWMGVNGGDRAQAINEDAFRYLRLEFDGDFLIGALCMGFTQHVGAIRGLLQTKIPLGPWKDILLRHPHRVMEAYLARTQSAA